MTIASYAQRNSEKEKGKHGFSRHMLIELILRLAKFFYASGIEAHEKHRALHGSIEGNTEDIIKCTKAFEIFYN